MIVHLLNGQSVEYGEAERAVYDADGAVHFQDRHGVDVGVRRADEISSVIGEVIPVPAVEEVHATDVSESDAIPNALDAAPAESDATPVPPAQ